MSSKRRRREDEEEIQRRKKALKKSFQRDYSGQRRMGSKRLSDSQKFILVASVAIIIIMIVAVQFLVPRTPYCYFTEVDFIRGTLDQETKEISFNRIVAWYHLRPERTVLSCDITDYFDPAFGFDIDIISNSVSGSIYTNTTGYRITDQNSAFSFATFMENGTEIPISTWANLTVMNITPYFVPMGVPFTVNFKLGVVTNIAVDRCNISLKFNQSIADTTIEIYSVTNGTANRQDLSVYILNETIPANTQVLLDFDLFIHTNLTIPELNLLERGEIHLVMNDKLLSSFISNSPYTNFKEAQIDFSPFNYEREPTLKKTKLLDVVIDVPYTNITIKY